MRLAAFLSSCLLAFLGGHIVNYSVIFLALEWFNSHSLVGIGYGLCFGPPLILGWFAGVYCDRYSPRKVILVAQNSFFISLFLLYLGFSASDDSQLALLLTAALFSGIGWSFVAPARFATLPFYVSKKKLTGATIALNLMVMMGFGLAPMLLKQIQVMFNWQAVLLTATVMFAISTALLLPLSFKFTAKPANKAFDEIKMSLAFVGKSVHLKQLLILASIAYLLMGPMQVILPSIAKNNLALTDTAQGNYLSLIAFSLIAGGLLAMYTKTKGYIGMQLMTALLIAGAGIGYLANETNLSISVITLIISASCGGLAISLIVAGLQRYSSDEHRGRIMSFYTIIGQAIPALSGIVSGFLAQKFNPEVALMTIAAVIVIAMLLALLTLKTIRMLQSFALSKN